MTHAKRTYGMRCYGCKAEVDVICGKNAHLRLEEKARRLGWGMGLMASGQAYFSCPDCASGLYNFKILIPVHRKTK